MLIGNLHVAFKKGTCTKPHYLQGQLGYLLIRRWLNIFGKPAYLEASRMYINCEGEGGNGWRVRLWKYELVLFAQESGLEIYINHCPSGISKWNKIEQRLFCYITKN